MKRLIGAVSVALLALMAVPAQAADKSSSTILAMTGKGRNT